MKRSGTAGSWILVAVSVSAFAAAVLTQDNLGRADAQAPSNKAQSAAIFTKMATVLQSPRCMNCHTSTEFPRQADDRHRHIMSVMRGTDDHGVASLRCQVCHREVNSSATGVPGAPDWHLAPLSMAWEGLSVQELCRSLFDPKRGGLGPDQLVAHLETDLVQWAWSPGKGLDGNSREPPPVPRETFLALARDWIATGTSCPTE
jgi:hypothetical protein